MVMSLRMLDARTRGSQSEMGSAPRFGSGGLCQTVRPLFCWVSCESETKRVFSGVSLGNPRASPPRIRSRTGGTHSISMGCEADHFVRRQFFGKPITGCTASTTQVQNRKGEIRLPDALSPSCLSDSMNLLQMSKGKVLQHFMHLQHLAGLLSWSAQACAAAKRCCDRRPIRR